jgi:hypothetical protein
MCQQLFREGKDREEVADPPRQRTGRKPAPILCLDFAKAAAGYVVDEATDGDLLGNPGMSAQLLELVADIFFDILESVEEGRSNGGGAGVILNSGAQILLGGVHQAAIGVVDDHDFFRAEKVVRDDEGAQGIIGDDATGVANDVGVSGLQTESADGEAGVHVGEDGEFALRARREFAQFVGAGIDFVGNENFVDYGPDGKSLAKEKRVGSG